MKIVHLTDLHVQTAPTLGELSGKRLLGSVNLYVLGRHRKFSPAVQQAAVDAALREAPDVVVITGDLTAQALEAEFQAARALLDPLLTRQPTVLLPGNHDTYVHEPSPGARMRAHFGPWMGSEAPHLHCIGAEVGFLWVETCRTHLLSSGHTPATQLARARALLAETDPARFVFLCLHYPLRGRRGDPYGPATRALDNARQVEAELLLKTDRIGAVLHGHEHHGYRTEVETGGGLRPSLNPGASGYAWLPAQHRTAHLPVYTVEDGALQEVRRLHYDGQDFVEEPGGAYATGR